MPFCRKTNELTQFRGDLTAFDKETRDVATHLEFTSLDFY